MATPIVLAFAALLLGAVGGPMLAASLAASAPGGRAVALAAGYVAPALYALATGFSYATLTGLTPADANACRLLNARLLIAAGVANTAHGPQRTLALNEAEIAQAADFTTLSAFVLHMAVLGVTNWVLGFGCSQGWYQTRDVQFWGFARQTRDCGSATARIRERRAVRPSDRFEGATGRSRHRAVPAGTTRRAREKTGCGHC